MMCSDHKSIAATLKLELDGSPKDVFARCPNSLPNSRGVGDGDNMKLPDRTAMRQIPAREKSPQGHSVLRSDIASKLSSYIEKVCYQFVHRISPWN